MTSRKNTKAWFDGGPDLLRASAALVVAVLALCVAIGSFVPLLPWLWAFVPTLALLCVGLVTAALFARVNTWVGALAGIISVVLMGAWGAMLRHEGTVKWAELAEHDNVSIERRVQVPLLEPISMSSNVRYVRFSPALYDSIEPACGDAHCLSFGGLDRAYSWTEELLNDAIAGVRLSMAAPDAVARIDLAVEQRTEDGVVTIKASLRDSQGEFATMHIRRPDTDRVWSAPLPEFLQFVLEHNRLSVGLYPPRPEASKTPLADFLRQAIDIVGTGSGIERRLSARVVRKISTQDRRLSRDTPEAAAVIARRPIDPACADRVTLVPPPRGTSLGYLALADLPVRIPYPAAAQVICRRNHVYLLTYGGEWGMHTFARYSLDGSALGVYRIGSPDEQPPLTADFWLVDADSLQEDGNHLTYEVNGWIREWVNRSPQNRHEDIIHKYRLIWQIPL